MRNSPPTVVFPDSSPLLLSALARVTRPLPDLLVHAGTPDPDELVRRVAGQAIVLNNESLFDAEIVRRCPDLRSIVFLGTGTSSYIDLQACRDRGIAVHGVAGYGDRTVAEHSLALLFAVYRDLACQHLALRGGGWSGAPIGELRGKTIGVVGMGGIGRELASMASALGMNVIAWTRTPSPHPRVEFVELDALLARADVVSLHLALTPETNGLLDAARLGLMKPGAVLINTARGALVDEGEVARMLREGRLAGAGIDVFAIEPLPADHPYRTAPRITLTAHTGWQSPEAIARLVNSAVEIVHAERARLAVG